MWKWGVIIVIFVGVLAGLYWQRELVINRVHNEQARRKVYPTEYKQSKYPGMGASIIQKEEQALVEPEGVGTPLFVPISQVPLYQNEKYKVTILPAQEQPLYIVGRAAGWEEITGSSDKYLILTDQNKYRVGIEQSELFGYDMMGVTSLFVEDVRENWDGSVNKIGRAEPQMPGMGWRQVQKQIRRGDSVAVIPVFDPPYWASRDSAGNYIASQIVVRRWGSEL